MFEVSKGSRNVAHDICMNAGHRIRGISVKLIYYLVLYVSAAGCIFDVLDCVSFGDAIAHLIPMGRSSQAAYLLEDLANIEN